MKRIIFAFLIGGFLTFSACQAVFTYSPFTFLQRDLASLPAEQQENRARDSLSSGNTSEMAEAYVAVIALLADNDDPDPDLVLLAADLAFGASGITDVFTSILQDPDSLTGAATEELTGLLELLDLDLIAEGAVHVQNAATADADIADTQYIIAAAALLAGAAEKAGSFEDLATLTAVDDGYDELQDAEAFLEAAGASDLLEMFSL
ncbi:MAG: hypothetical protein HN368_11555 [Spirochaetales bacterium]|jgi:hypothetical protein|nr:hypothetical protein [Spirochaetales bacterium]